MGIGYNIPNFGVVEPHLGVPDTNEFIPFVGDVALPEFVAPPTTIICRIHPTAFTLSDGLGGVVQFAPEFDYANESENIMDSHRTRGGGLVSYTWSRYTRISFTINYLNSSDQATVNNWWDANSNLTFVDENPASNHTVRLVNAGLPFAKLNTPYRDMYTGVVELESY